MAAVLALPASLRSVRPSRTVRRPWPRSPHPTLGRQWAYVMCKADAERAMQYPTALPRTIGPQTPLSPAPAMTMEDRQRRIAAEMAAQFAEEAAAAQELYPEANPITGDGFPHLLRRPPMGAESAKPAQGGVGERRAGS